ncbi:hypothetical protein EC968_009484 [Mortierella alpina]|nr:hypothetical protein EC968_009484 [Mortierella alpina]
MRQLPLNGPFQRRQEPPPLSAPVGSVGPASCYFNGTWYIQGGFNNEAFRPYGYTLNLKTPWYTSQPPWVPLPSSPYAGLANTCIVSISGYPHLNLTGPALVIMGNEIKEQPLMSVLDLTTRKWHGNATNAPVPYRNKGLIPVGDPNDGKIYIRGGFHSTNFDTMDVYNPKTDSFESRPIPEIPLSPLFGGDLCNGGTGVPRARCGKVVVFGGQDGDRVFADIYILDLGTSIWRKGASELEPRTEMACAMHDDGFLIWGGKV